MGERVCSRDGCGARLDAARNKSGLCQPHAAIERTKKWVAKNPEKARANAQRREVKSRAYRAEWRRKKVAAERAANPKVPRVCSEPECGKPHFCDGHCRHHYVRRPDQRAKQAERVRAARRADPEGALARDREHRQSATRVQWVADNAAVLRGRVVAWKAENKDKVTSDTQRRRAALASAPGTHTADQWREKLGEYGRQCPACGSKDRLSLDHVMPISWGGTNDIDNIQPLCVSCNARKAHRSMVRYAPWNGVSAVVLERYDPPKDKRQTRKSPALV